MDWMSQITMQKYPTLRRALIVGAVIFITLATIGFIKAFMAGLQ